MSRNKTISWIIFIALSLIWGSSFILMKKGAEHLNGWQIGAVRMFSAGLVFIPFAIFHISSIPKKKIPLIILSASIGNLFPAFLFAIAIQREIESSVAGILNSLTPLFVIVIGALFFHMSVPRKKVAGVLIGLVGVILLSILKEKITISDVGFTLLILLATIFYGINVNIVSIYFKGIDPFKLASVSLAFMTIPAGIVLWQQEVIPMALADNGFLFSMSMAIILGLMGTSVSTSLYYILIKKSGALFASLVTYVIPIVAIAWGLWANEPLGILQVVCLAIILSGVYIANRS